MWTKRATRLNHPMGGAHDVALDSMRIHGGYGYAKDLPVERYYRDAPLLMIGGGTNELQRILIARGLLRQQGYRSH